MAILPMLAFGIALLLVAVGIIGVFIPFVPGVPLAWLGLLLYAFATHFATISKTVLLIFLLVVALTSIVDFVAPLIGARRYHASRYGIIGSSLGLMVGLFTLGPLGIVIGPLAGAFLGELIAGKPQTDAIKSAWGAFVGFLAGTLIKLVAILVMAGFLIYSLF